MAEAELADVASRGGDIVALCALASQSETRGEALASALKELGFTKLGQRHRITQALLRSAPSASPPGPSSQPAASGAQLSHLVPSAASQPSRLLGLQLGLPPSLEAMVSVCEKRTAPLPFVSKHIQ